MEEKDIGIGDMVKWYEYYAEGDIVRDAGLGVVTRVIEPTGKPYIGEETLYLVVHNAEMYTDWYVRRNIELYKKAPKLNNANN